MEFPLLGKHCIEPTCNRLDFLPVKCDACHKTFCSLHFNYARHNCPGSYKQDVQVPICPLCSEPVPTAPGVEPDLTVGQHIDQKCKSDTKKIYTNHCNAKGCKRRELIPVTCTQCKLNFCLRHRHTTDHDCKVTSATGSPQKHTKQQSIFKSTNSDARSMAAKAAEQRRNYKPTTLFHVSPKSRAVMTTQHSLTTQVKNIQGNMTEDEALARALALSIMELDESAECHRRNEITTPTRVHGQRVAVGGRDEQHANGKEKCTLS